MTIEYNGIDDAKVGDIMRYTGTMSGGDPVESCVIQKLQGPDSIFNQQMAIVSDVDHWVSVRELERVSDDK